MEQRSCYAERYCNLYSETTTDNPTSDGETILFYVCRVLNTTVWPQLIDSNKDEEVNFQFSSLQSTAVLTDSSSSLVLNLLHARCYKVDMQISYAMSIKKPAIMLMNLWYGLTFVLEIKKKNLGMT